MNLGLKLPLSLLPQLEPFLGVGRCGRVGVELLFSRSFPGVGAGVAVLGNLKTMHLVSRGCASGMVPNLNDAHQKNKAVMSLRIVVVSNRH